MIDILPNEEHYHRLSLRTRFERRGLLNRQQAPRDQIEMRL